MIIQHAYNVPANQTHTGSPDVIIKTKTMFHSYHTQAKPAMHIVVHDTPLVFLMDCVNLEVVYRAIEVCVLECYERNREDLKRAYNHPEGGRALSDITVNQKHALEVHEVTL